MSEEKECTDEGFRDTESVGVMVQSAIPSRVEQLGHTLRFPWRWRAHLRA